MTPPARPIRQVLGLRFRPKIGKLKQLKGGPRKADRSEQVELMRNWISEGVAPGPWQAADKVVASGLMPGRGSDKSKVIGLYKDYCRLFGTRPPS